MKRMEVGFEWENQAECKLRGVPPEEFYPDTGYPGRGAVAACAACPVKAECAQAARRRREHGYWAGAMHNNGIPQRRSTAHTGSLRERMTAAGVTIRALSEIIGTPAGTVSRWAAGAHIPDKDRREAVERAVGPVVWKR